MKSSLKVTLIAHTPEPEKLIAGAAKLCYSSAGVGELYDGLDDEKSASFLHMLTGLGHASPVEHSSFTFGIEGVSRSLLAQLTRHRLASYSVKSQRYVEEGRISFVLPPEIEKDERAVKIFLKSMEDAQKAYNELTSILKERHLKDMLKDGASEKKALSAATKKAIEDARYVLPNACETKLVLTMNARNLMHFFNLRCCTRAQWEIRELANEMLRQVKRAAPTLFERSGPSCVSGQCPEGQMSCGRASEMMEFYEAL